VHRHCDSRLRYWGGCYIDKKGWIGNAVPIHLVPITARMLSSMGITARILSLTGSGLTQGTPDDAQLRMPGTVSASVSERRRHTFCAHQQGHTFWAAGQKKYEGCALLAAACWEQVGAVEEAAAEALLEMVEHRLHKWVLSYDCHVPVTSVAHTSSCASPTISPSTINPSIFCLVFGFVSAAPDAQASRPHQKHSVIHMRCLSVTDM